MTLLVPTSSGRKETGIGRYCAQVLRAFERKGIPVEAKYLRHHLIEIAGHELGYYLKFVLYFAKFRVMPRTRRSGEVVHSFSPMIVPPETAVVTLWDLIPFHTGLRHVQRRPPLYSVVTMLAERNMLEYPSLYVTISDTVRQEMREYYRLPLERIRVARPSADLDLFRPIQDPDVPFSRDKVNILHVGTAVPRKNILGIVEALGRLDPRRFRLVRVGPPTDPRVVEEYTRRAKELGLEILELGYTPDKRLPAYYSAADLMLFPSTAEGAGIPPLEAMACGTNVVVSDIPVHREMCADAALYCKTDPESIAAAIERALSSPRTPEVLRAHVASWTWDDVADMYLKIYEELGLKT